MKKLFFFILLVTLALTKGIVATANEPVFRHVTTAEGLPDNQIEGLFIAPDGRLGIISPAVLALYDATTFETYPYSGHMAYHWVNENIPIAINIDSAGRVWIKKSNTLHVFDTHKQRFVSNIDSLLYTMGMKEQLTNMFVGGEDNLWFVTKDGELWLNKENGTTAVKLPSDLSYRPTIISAGSCNGRDWLAGSNGDLWSWDNQAREIRRQETGLRGKITPEDRVIIAPAKGNDFWVMWDNGVAYYDFLKSKWVIPNNLKLKDGDIFTSMQSDSQGNAWIGTGQSGYIKIDATDKNAVCHPTLKLTDGLNIFNDITYITINRTSDELWAGMMAQGLAYCHPDHNTFEHLSCALSRCMVKMPDDILMLGTLEGVKRYNPATGKIDVPFKDLSKSKCRAMMLDRKGDLWIGTLYEGLYRISDNKIVNHYYNPQLTFHVFNTELDFNSILAMSEDSEGNIWVSVRGGVCAFDPETGKFTPLKDSYPQLEPYKTCYSIIDDGEGNLIVGSTSGLFIFNPIEGIKMESKDRPEFELCDYYNDIFIDSRGLIWLGTQNGIQIMDENKNSVHYISPSHGLGNGVIKSIIEDNMRNMWISTSHGLTRIEVTKEGDNYKFELRPYSDNSGLLAGEYYTKSKAIDENGNLYFGGNDGITTFNPEKFTFNLTENKPIITSLYLGETKIEPSAHFEGKVIIDNNIGEAEKIILRHDQNYVTLLFSGLNFANPSQTFYRYKLEGLDDDWTETSFSNMPGKVSYSNLAPGEYTFKVYTANNDNVWTTEPTELKIKILPPFYATIWAKIIYVLLFFLVIYLVWRFYQNKNVKKMQRIRQEEALKQKEELDQMKFKFFTNVSHEFRTPLTLIITPLQSLIKKMDEGEDKERLKSIQRNASQLLGLVNQLLDFRKVEMKGSTLKLKNGNIRELVTTIVDSFSEIAKEKGINLSLDTENLTNPYMALDNGKVHKILNNLLSNAMKYTPAGGLINVELANYMAPGGTPSVTISVSDTGIGIPAKDIEHVFERFFQASNNHTEGKGSSGVGLHLIKELTTLHKGMVKVESVENEGTTFTVTLPANLHIESPQPEEAKDVDVPVVNEKPIETNEKPMVLIVEDNDEFRHFMCTELSSLYNVIDAPDGKIGAELAKEKNPDIIISDVMMPVMDGIEMCKNIKNDVETSHIPVILLTARTNDESRAQGYEAGADAYLSKPFDMDALLARVRKLIQQKQERQSSFRKEITVTPSTIAITSLDEKLVQKALESVERNMDNTEYSVEDLSADLAMTRATLYRKMEGITGQTPKDFIRTIRLKRAAQLLRDTDLSITEIAYMSGFSSPRIFTKSFKDQYGVIPSQYLNRAGAPQDAESQQK